MDASQAYSLIEHAIDEERVPGGYLIVGDLNGNCREIVDKILLKLYPDGQEQIKESLHPDVAILEPEGKSRTIQIKSMRERIVVPMSAAAYSGGWKVGVIYGADRMQPAAANAFLKSLEEPTPKTLYLLLTDKPDALLATIVSRCQRIDLPMPKGILEGEYADRIAEVFGGGVPNEVYEKMQAAKYLAAILDDAIDAAPKEEAPVVKKAFFSTIMAYARKWMEEDRLPLHQAFRNVEAVEEAFARVERYLGAESVLSFMMDKITLPAK
ncbi:MAG: hypothetical protein J6P13_07195 [Kiritimatiellae bacterium]|nr:hypothetical protein [Kiritimatiellia bacterium]